MEEVDRAFQRTSVRLAQALGPREAPIEDNTTIDSLAYSEEQAFLDRVLLEPNARVSNHTHLHVDRSRWVRLRTLL